MIRTALLILAAATAAATPLTWKKTTRDAELSLQLPPLVRHAPVLAGRLYRGEIKALEEFAAQAADPKDGRPSEPAAFRAHGRWEMQVTYTPALETQRLISVYREAYLDSQGAHPNHELGGVVFDKATSTNLHPIRLLKPDANLAPLDKALCDAARAAKRERNGQDWNEKEDSNFTCPTWSGVRGLNGKMREGASPPQVALTPGDVAGKAAGLTFIYSPYDLGAYAEGPYEVVAPLSVFQSVLKPDYAAEFAGRPKPSHRLDE